MRFGSVFGFTSFVAAFVLNPAYFAGCISLSGGEEPNFKYGAKEMASLIRAASDGYEFMSDGTNYRLELVVKPNAKPAHASARPAAFARLAHACGQRSLYATASACIDSSSMPVTGKLSLLRILDDGSEATMVSDVVVSGDLLVLSTVLSSGEIYLSFDHGSIGLSSSDGKSFKLHEFTASWQGAAEFAVHSPG